LKIHRVIIIMSFVTMLLLQSVAYAHREVDFVTSFGGKGEAKGKFAKETYWAFDKDGNIYVSDTENYRIQKFDKNGQFLMQIDASAEDAGFVFQNPTDIAVEDDGSIYVLDWAMVHIANTESPKVFNYGPSVRKFSRDGKFIALFTIDDLTRQVKNLESAAPGLDEDGNYALIIPQGKTDRKFLIAVDGQGNIYVLDKDDSKIYKLNAEGKLTFGSYGSGNGQFIHAADIDADDNGNLYVADTDNHRIVKFDAEGKAQTFGEYGDEAGQLSSPFQIAVLEDGNILVADKVKYRKNYISTLVRREDDPAPRYVLPNHALEPDSITYKNFRVIMQRVQKFSPEGKFKDKVLVRFAQDNPIHVNLNLKAIDHQGNLYFMDSDTLLLHKYAPASAIKFSEFHKELTFRYEWNDIEVDIDNPDDLDAKIGVNASDYDDDVNLHLFWTNLRFSYDFNENLRLSLSNLAFYLRSRNEIHYMRKSEDILGTFNQDDQTLEDYFADVIQFDASIVLNHEPYRYREAGLFVYFGGGKYDYVNDALASSNLRYLDWRLWFSQWGAGIHYDLGRKFRLLFSAAQGPPGGYFNYEYDYIDELGDLYATGFRDGKETMVFIAIDGVF